VPGASPFRDLIEESLEEATFLLGRWESELASLTRNLDEVWFWTEDRLQGALDGVRAAGADAVEVGAAGLLSDDTLKVAASAAVLGLSRERGATQAVTAALAEADGDKLRAMVRGLELLGSGETLRASAVVLSRREPVIAGALCRLKAFRRVAPDDEVMTAIKSNDAEAQVEAIRAAVYSESPHAEGWIIAAMSSDKPAVRVAAVESGLTLGIRRAWETAARRARRLDEGAGAYLKLAAMFGTAADHEAVYSALGIPDLQLEAIWALGHIGTARAVESCLAGMEYEALARACGEAYCWITGAELARDRLTVEEMPPEAPAFEDDDLDADLVPPPGALWPLPDVEATRRHWQTRSAAFAADERHIHGRVANGETLMVMVESGPMLRRHDLAFQLRAKSRGRYDVETRAFAARQRQMMAAARAAVSLDRQP
jgi:uncharacterized protein (TIGR02270 family)